MTEKPPRKLIRPVGYAALFLFLLAALYPIVRITVAARSGGSDSFATLLGDPAFTRFLLTAATAAVSVTVGVVVVAWLIAKAISRRSSQANTTNAAVAAKLLAIPMLLVPLYAVTVRIGQIGAELGMIIIAVAVALPFCIWQLKTFYDAIPVAVEEAALLDGCSRGQISRLILLPLLWPAIAFGAAFSFMSAWLACTFLPLIARVAFGGSQPAALAIDTGAQSATYAAAALLLVVPLLVALLFFGWRLRGAAVLRWDIGAAAPAGARQFN